MPRMLPVYCYQLDVLVFVQHQQFLQLWWKHASACFLKPDRASQTLLGLGWVSRCQLYQRLEMSNLLQFVIKVKCYHWIVAIWLQRRFQSGIDPEIRFWGIDDEESRLGQYRSLLDLQLDGNHHVSITSYLCHIEVHFQCKRHFENASWFLEYDWYFLCIRQHDSVLNTLHNIGRRRPRLQTHLN